MIKSVFFFDSTKHTHHTMLTSQQMLQLAAVIAISFVLFTLWKQIDAVKTVAEESKTEISRLNKKAAGFKQEEEEEEDDGATDYGEEEEVGEDVDVVGAGQERGIDESYGQYGGFVTPPATFGSGVVVDEQTAVPGVTEHERLVRSAFTADTLPRIEDKPGVMFSEIEEEGGEQGMGVEKEEEAAPQQEEGKQEQGQQPRRRYTRKSKFAQEDGSKIGKLDMFV